MSASPTVSSWITTHRRKAKGSTSAWTGCVDFSRNTGTEYRTAEGWVLKADVRHFFASIDHDKLKKKLKKLDLEPIVFDLLCTYIDSTDGLPLGYQTSQLFALLFLDEFDHFVKERLLASAGMAGYMDELFLIHPDKDSLQFCLKEIRAFMASLGLELNEKTQIFPIRNGIDFLGFHTYLTEEGKVASASCGTAASSVCAPSSADGSRTIRRAL